MKIGLWLVKSQGICIIVMDDNPALFYIHALYTLPPLKVTKSYLSVTEFPSFLFISHLVYPVKVVFWSSFARGTDLFSDIQQLTIR